MWIWSAPLTPEALVDQFNSDSRHFATRELKAFMAFLLMRYTLELDPNSAERPTFVFERVGAGVMDPRGDLRVILRARH